MFTLKLSDGAKNGQINFPVWVLVSISSFFDIKATSWLSEELMEAEFTALVSQKPAQRLAKKL